MTDPGSSSDPSPQTRIAIVVQRYGEMVVGGAESHARQLAEKLHEALGWEVDVYTTCAVDYTTWANALPVGQEVLNGIKVIRFRTPFPRARFLGFYKRLTDRFLRAAQSRRWLWPYARLIERLWIILQGPYCPGLVRSVVAQSSRYKKVLFFTYLYYPTIVGVQKLRGHALLIPTAHDEPPFYFQVVRDTLLAAGSILANTIPELNLVARRIGASSTNDGRLAVAGLGFDPQAHAMRAEAEIQAPRYLLYLGRICEAKGVGCLISWFHEWRRARPDVDVRLVLAGHREDRFSIPEDRAIDDLGYVTEARKATLIRGASAVVNLSPHESLSLIVIEALAAGVPVITGETCEIFRYYATEVKTLWTCASQGDFATALNRVLDLDWTSTAHDDLVAARQWALARFAWPQVLEVFKRHVGMPPALATSGPSQASNALRALGKSS